MTTRARKRSSAVTLLLAGGLAGCSGEPVPQQDAYQSLQDCVRDWGNAAQCAPVRDDRYASSYYYGPAYFRSRYADGRPKPSPNAMDAVDLPQGTPVAAGASRAGAVAGGRSHAPGADPVGNRSASAGPSTRAGFGGTASARGSASS